MTRVPGVATRSVAPFFLVLPTPLYAESAAAAPSLVHPSPYAVYFVISILYLLIALAVVAIINALSTKTPPGASRGWSLADAVSEEATITGPTGTAVTVLVASSSRLIALLGMIVIMGLFLGVGTTVVWDLALNDTTPDLSGVLQYFLAGAGLFVPYSINQIRAGFESIGK